MKDIIKKNTRESGIELLRIFMILGVIFLHCCNNGGYMDSAHLLGEKHFYLAASWRLFCRCPIYVFIMITGYFSVKKINNYQDVFKRLKKIYIPMLFYSVVIPVLGFVLGLWNFSDINIPKMFFPFLGRTWYFITLYILIIILAPYINRLLNNLSKKEHLILVLILTFIFSIWGTLAYLKPFNTFIGTDLIFKTQGGKSLYNFIFMYIIGAYLSLYIKDEKRLDYKYLGIFIILGIWNILLVYLFPSYGEVVIYNDNIFVVLQCICLILFFRSLKFKSKIINYLASFTLTVYIIHEHFLIRNFIWNKVFKLHELSFYSNYIYPLKIVAICLIIFVSCIILDQLRKWLFIGIEKVFKSKYETKEI